MPASESRSRFLREQIAQYGQNPDTGMPAPGENTPMQERRLATGKPLPEGLRPQQYPLGQLADMGVNVHEPHVPMTPFTGTFTNHPAGGLTPRAPAERMPVDPPGVQLTDTQREARRHGIDYTQYGDEDVTQLEEDVAAAKAREDRKVQTGSVSTPLVPSKPNGTRVWKPDSEKMELYNAEREANIPRPRRMQFAKEIILRNNLTGDEAEAVYRMADQPDGFAALREHNDKSNTAKKVTINGNLEDRWDNINFVRDFQNPNMNHGLLRAGLMQAAAENDPLQMAGVHWLWGNQQGASDAMTAHGTQETLNAAERQQQRAADAATKAAEPRAAKADMDMAMADILKPGVEPGETELNLATQVFTNMGLDPVAARNAAMGYIRDHLATMPASHGHDLVTAHLKQLAKKGKPQFMHYATQTMRLTDAEAEVMWDAHASVAQQWWNRGQ